MSFIKKKKEKQGCLVLFFTLGSGLILFLENGFNLINGLQSGTLDRTYDV